MRVNLYYVAEDGTETLTDANVLLDDCYPGPENADDYADAHSHLLAYHEYFTGGGTAPLRVIRSWWS
jgi:hypothetical protein